MKRIPLIMDRLNHRAAPWAIVAVALCLTLPSLFVGFATDDHNWRAVFQGYPGMEEVEQAPWDAFRFHFSDDDVIRQDRMDRGLLPWWAGEQTHTAFMRPLSSLSHWLDYTIFGDTAWTMHVHSMALFGLLLVLVAALYRQLIDVRHVALLALLLYAIDDARGIPVGWLSARNSLLTALFGVAVLLSHDQFRRRGRRWGLPVALLSLCIGLLCGEATVSIGGYLFAYALFVDPKGFRRGFVTLLPYGVVVIVWRVIYQHLGYGAFGSGAYVNPTDEPLLFAYRIAERLPVLFFGAFGLPDSTFYNFLPSPWSGVYFVVALVFLAIVLLALWPLLRQDARARFWLLGMTLAALPACLTSPQDRMLMFPALGGMALIASYLEYVRSHVDIAWGRRALAGFWAVAHLVIAPALLLLGSYVIAFVEAAAQDANASLPQDAAIADETIVLVHTMSDLMGPGITIFRASLNQPVPKNTWMLSAGNQSVTVTREDERTLVLAPEGGFLLPTWAELFRSAALEPATPGDTVNLDGMEVMIREVLPDGRPSVVAFRFAAPLETATYHWYFWGSTDYQPFDLPAVGDSSHIPPRHSTPTAES